MRAYRLAPVVWEATTSPDELWVASVPDGPLVRVGGVGAAIFDVLLGGVKAGQPLARGADIERLAPLLSVDEIVAEITRLAPDVPSDAEERISRFLDDMEVHGVVEQVQR